mgnify:CR=1 FL=1
MAATVDDDVQPVLREVVGLVLPPAEDPFTPVIGDVLLTALTAQVQHGGAQWWSDSLLPLTAGVVLEPGGIFDTAAQNLLLWMDDDGTSEELRSDMVDDDSPSAADWDPDQLRGIRSSLSASDARLAASGLSGPLPSSGDAVVSWCGVICCSRLKLGDGPDVDDEYVGRADELAAELRARELALSVSQLGRVAAGGGAGGVKCAVELVASLVAARLDAEGD